MDLQIQEITSAQMEDIIEGAVILGCGGGGDPRVARRILTDLSGEGLLFSLVDPASFPPEAFVCVLGYVGGGIDEKEQQLIAGRPVVWEHPILKAAAELSVHERTRFDAYVCSEIGAGNIMANFLVAAREGKPVLDGDIMGGRAKPEMSISLINIFNLPAAPLAAATHYGDVAVFTEVLSHDRVEQLCRYMARASNGRLAVARSPSRWKVLARAVHPGTVSDAMAIGRIVRDAESNKVERIADAMKATCLCQGRIEEFTRFRKDGFVSGEIHIQAGGEAYRIWYKNENLVAWSNGQLHATCPDLIMLLDAQTGRGIYNWDDQLENTKEVVVLGKKAPDIWTSARGLELFGPQCFGFDFNYKSISED